MFSARDTSVFWYLTELNYVPTSNFIDEITNLTTLTLIGNVTDMDMPGLSSTIAYLTGEPPVGSYVYHTIYFSF